MLVLLHLMKISCTFPTPQHTGERGGAGGGSYTGDFPQGAISDQNFRILGPPPSLVCRMGVGGKTTAIITELGYLLNYTLNAFFYMISFYVLFVSLVFAISEI